MSSIEVVLFKSKYLRISTRRQSKEQGNDHDASVYYYGNSKVHFHIVEEKRLDLFSRKKENMGTFTFHKGI